MIVEKEKKTWGAPGMANVAVLESSGVISMSSAFPIPSEVSERSGDDWGAWCGAVSEAAVFDDDEEAIRVGKGLVDFLEGKKRRARNARRPALRPSSSLVDLPALQRSAQEKMNGQVMGPGGGAPSHDIEFNGLDRGSS
jgi:hypothetical protein